jgi:hypothetical protein
MKDADVERLWQQVTDEVRAESKPADFIGRMVDQREVRKRFARACEQQGIERAKAGARLQDDPSRDDPHGGEFWFIDWSALDAEIEKENEGG